MKKKLLASLLALCMVFSLLPVSAFAAEDENAVKEPDVSIETQADVEQETTSGDQSTDTDSTEDADPTPDADGVVTVTTADQLTTALTNTAVKTIKLGAKIENASSLTISRGLTLDLNGNELSFASSVTSYAIAVNTTEKVTVTSTGTGTDSAKGKLTASSGRGIHTPKATENETQTVSNIEVNNVEISTSIWALVNRAGCTMTVTNCKVTASGDAGVENGINATLTASGTEFKSNKWTLNNRANGTMKLTGGSVEATAGLAVDNEANATLTASSTEFKGKEWLLINRAKGVMSLTGCTVTATDLVAVENNGGNVTIDGGTYKAAGATLVNRTGGTMNAKGGGLAVEATGTKGSDYAVQNDGTMTISGGDFKNSAEKGAGSCPVILCGTDSAKDKTPAPSLIITNAKVTSANGIGVTSANGGDVTIGSGADITAKGNALGGNNTRPSANTTIEGTAKLTSSDDAAIYQAASGVLTIKGGEMTGKAGIVVRAGAVEITGGTITANGSEDLQVGDKTGTIPPCGIVYDYDATYQGNENKTTLVKISGGTIKAASGKDAVKFLAASGSNVKAKDKFSITGGTFSSDPSKVSTTSSGTESYLPFGYVATETADKNEWKVAPKSDGLVVEAETKDGVSTATIAGTITGGTGDTATDNESDGSGASGSVGTTSGKLSVTVTAPAPTSGQTTKAAVAIPADTAATVDKVNSLTVKVETKASGDNNAAEQVSLDLDKNLLNGIKEAGDKKADVNISVTEVEADSSVTSSGNTVKVFDVKVEAVSLEGNESKTENLMPAGGSGTVTITIPWTGNAPNVYLSVGGKPVQSMGTATLTNGKASYKARHLSEYMFSSTELTPAPVTYTANNGTETAATNLASAFTSVKDGGTIKLYADVTLTEMITLAPQDVNSGKDITIDGQGHKITLEPADTDKKTAMFYFDQDNDGVTFKNITLNPDKKGAAIWCDGGSVTLTDSTVTAGDYSDAVGSIYFGGNKTLTLDGTTKVSGNTTGADVYIASTVKSEINGEANVGSIFVNANAADNGTLQQGELAVKGGTVDKVTLEANASNTAKLTEAKAGSVKELLIALGTDTDRAVAKITPTGNLSNVQGFKIPDGQTAKITGGTTADGKTTATLKNALTIGTGATLVIPEDVTVKVEKSGSSAAVPTITNNGTLQVNGSLIAGTSAESSDNDYLTISGSGTVQAGPNAVVDVDKASNMEITITLNYGNGAANGTMKLFTTKSGDTINKVRIGTLPTPTYANHTFNGWFTAASGGTKVTADTQYDADATIYAQWTYTGSSGGSTSSGSTGGGGSSSAAVTVSSAVGGKVTVSSNSAKKGDTVTITATPDTGKVVDTVTVTDKDGKTVAVTDAGNGKYTFTMPDGKVTVKVTFKDKEKDPISYTDVAAGAWYFNAVKFVSENGLMNGVGNGRFAPESNLSRAMLAQILYNKEGKPSVTSGSVFKDVPGGTWYTDAVTWAAGKAIVSGYGNGKFGPNDDITREQLAVMLWKYSGSPEPAGSKLNFTDADKTSSWAMKAVLWATEQGIINGKGNGVLDPGGYATRAEVAQMLKNFLDK